MDVIYIHRKLNLRIMLFLNLIICLIYGIVSEPSVAAMGIMFFLLPLLFIHLIITIIGHNVKNRVLHWICLIFSLIFLIASIYYSLTLN